MIKNSPLLAFGKYAITILSFLFLATLLTQCSDGDSDSDGFTVEDGDCDDSNSSIFPGALEICGNGIDEDCNGRDLDCGDVDMDGDGITANGGDCNDNDPNIRPSAQEICGNGIDEDCNGSDLDCNDVDRDGDGFSFNQGDCDDMNVGVGPNMYEICGDGIDNNCDGEDFNCGIFPGERIDNFILFDDLNTQLSKADLTEDALVFSDIQEDGSYIHVVVIDPQGYFFFVLSDSETVGLSDVPVILAVATPYAGTTELGIGIGSTLADAETAYGEPEIRDDDGSLDYLSLGLTFISDTTGEFVSGIFVLGPVDGFRGNVSKSIVRKTISSEFFQSVIERIEVN